MRLSRMITVAATAAMLAGGFSVGPAAADGLTARSLKDSRTAYCSIRGYGAGTFMADKTSLGTVDIDLGDNEYTFGAGFGCATISSKVLFGIEADYTWDKAKSEIKVPTATLFSLPHGPEWSVVGRVGYFPTQDTLIYILFGKTWAQSRDATMATTTFSLDGPGGLTYGGGLETVLTKNLRAFIEYRHTEFGSDKAAVGLMPITADSVRDQVRAGLIIPFSANNSLFTN